jgi:hypothetical protein
VFWPGVTAGGISSLPVLLQVAAGQRTETE